jgi:hypothetical protein
MHSSEGGEGKPFPTPINAPKSVTTLLRGLVLLIVPQSGTMLLWCTRDRVMSFLTSILPVQSDAETVVRYNASRLQHRERE